MRKQLLLSTAALAMLLTGAAAQTGRDEPARAGSQVRSQETSPQGRSQTERIPDVNRQNDLSRGAGQDQPRSDARGNTPADSTHPAQSGAQRQQPATQTQSGTPSTGRASGSQQPSQQGQAAQQNVPAASPATGNRQSTQQNDAAPSSRTTGNSQQSPSSADNQQTAPSQAQQTGRSQSQPGSGQAQAPAAGTQQSRSGIVSLSTQQQTRIGETIRRHNVKPLTNVNFSISVGTRVPRSVTLRALSSDLATFVPQYRGYSYFVVEEQIVIVEPSTLEIVSIVPYTSKTVRSESRKSAGASMNSRSVSLSNEQRDAIRKHAVKKKETTTRESSSRTRYKAGDVVERSVTIESFPEVVYEEVPVVRRYRYFREDDDVILVDPDEDRVVDVIR